jgi:hypothetical protein
MKTTILDFVLSHRMYGTRPSRHLAAFQMAPDWIFLECGSWTLEVFHCLTTTRRKGLFAATAVALLSALWAGGVPLLP